MTDWDSPEVIAQNGDSLSGLLHAFFGIYIWEWVIFLDADWKYVQNVKRQPQLIFCFLNRYCLLAALISVIISLNVTSEVNCQSYYVFASFLSKIALELANIAFTVRIVSLWRQDRLVPQRVLTVFLVACLIAQAWLTFDAPIRAPWKPEFGCALISSHTLLSNIGPIFGAGYSLVLLAFAIWEYISGDVLHPSAVTLKEIYWFGAAFLASCLNVVFIGIHLIDMIAIVPSTIISIASGRMSRLWEYSTQPTTLPETIERQSTATRSSHLRTRFMPLQLTLGRSPREAPEGPNFQRLDSAPASQTASYLGPDSMEDTNSTRPSSIILPSLISPTSTYNPNRDSQDPSTHLDSASESSDRGDRYDLDAQLGALRR